MPSFEFIGLDEFQADVKAVVQKYPEATQKFMKKSANQFTKDANEKLKSSKKTDAQTKNIEKRWKKTETYWDGKTIGIDIQNTAPHFHLVENGHEGYIPYGGANYIKSESKRNKKENTPSRFLRGDKTKMKYIGWVAGLFFTDKTREEWRESFPEKIADFVDAHLKEENL